MSGRVVGNGISLGWDMVNHLALTRIRSLVYCDSTYLDGVETLGVDELCWSHVRVLGK